MNKLRILIVDDLEIARREIFRILSSFGFTDMEAAEDGAKAIQALHQAATNGRPFQLVMCDWTMPVMSGLEVLKVCRSDASLKSPAFIMVTAEAGMALVIEAMNAGANDYVVKPVAPDVIKKKIEKIVARMPQ